MERQETRIKRVESGKWREEREEREIGGVGVKRLIGW